MTASQRNNSGQRRRYYHPVHFTLWPSRTSATGSHAELTWGEFLSLLSEPQVANDKNALPGWSPAKFAGDRRARAGTELVSCIVLDDDKSSLPLERVTAIWSGVSGVVHTSHSHTDEAPKYRIVLQCSRDMSPAEHERVHAHVRAYAASHGEALDEATKDPSRLWFVPARREGAPYACAELLGAPLPVDDILAVPRHAEHAVVSAPTVAQYAQQPDTRRAAMAAALGAAWPAKGRHEAQLALAGALRSEGWAAEDALEFLCSVCRAAGDEDRAKREATIAHTWALSPDAPMTGWSRLKALVDGVIVDAARGALGKDAAFSEATKRRLEAAVQIAPATVGDTVTSGRFTFKASGLDAPMAALSYLVDTLVVRGEVVMLVAHGNSLKTWLALSLGVSVASGRPWLGHYVVSRGRVAVLDFESGTYELTRRLKLIGARDADVGANLLRSSYSGASLSDPEAWVDLAGLGLSLLIIDSFAAAEPATDENDKRAALLLQNAGSFAEVTGCTVVVVHHANKNESGGDNRLRVRGSTAIFAACDRIFEFVDLEKGEDGRVSSTVKTIKDGAGRRPLPLRVELSDQGLRYVPIEPEVAPKPVDEINRERVINILKQHSAGASKENLVNLLSGRRDQRLEAISQLVLRGDVVEFREGNKAVIMLRPEP